MTPIEWVRDGDAVLGCIVPSSYRPERTTFLTPDAFAQQLGFIVYPAGGEVHPHMHRSLLRSVERTTEVVVVRSGRCIVDFYTEAGASLRSFELRRGDAVLLVSGGHGFRMLEPTILMEVKQGPYTGMDDKVRFGEMGGRKEATE